MKYQIRRTTRFKKEYKLAIRRGLCIEKLDRTIELLATDGFLPPEYRDHPLAGEWRGHRECHVEPDWLLVYRRASCKTLVFVCALPLRRPRKRGRLCSRAQPTNSVGVAKLRFATGSG